MSDLHSTREKRQVYFYYASRLLSVTVWYDKA